MKIRAKRSRGNRQSGNRYFTVRVLDSSGEHLIEFKSRHYDDWELRSGDLAAFLYRNDRVVIVHNFTIRKYYVADKSYLLAVIVGVVVVLVVFWWINQASQHR